MRTRGRATGAELAAATGLSLVTVYKELAQLMRSGEVQQAEQAAEPRGGRPARVYECDAGWARRVLLTAERQAGGMLHTALDIMDLQGGKQRRLESTWARLEPGSLDAWLVATLRRYRVASIALALGEAAHSSESTTLLALLRTHFTCPVALLCPAEALADKPADNTATLYLRRGYAPRCSIYRHGHATSAGALDLLPLPTAWSTLDYSDHTLVEEMIARLLQALACVLAPARIAVHADFWSTRLTERIRYNTQMKLKGRAPELHFRLTPPAAVLAALRTRALSL